MCAWREMNVKELSRRHGRNIMQQRKKVNQRWREANIRPKKEGNVEGREGRKEESCRG